MPVADPDARSGLAFVCENPFAATSAIAPLPGVLPFQERKSRQGRHRLTHGAESGLAPIEIAAKDAESYEPEF